MNAYLPCNDNMYRGGQFRGVTVDFAGFGAFVIHCLCAFFESWWDIKCYIFCACIHAKHLVLINALQNATWVLFVFSISSLNLG